MCEICFFFYTNVEGVCWRTELHTATHYLWERSHGFCTCKRVDEGVCVCVWEDKKSRGDGLGDLSLAPIDQLVAALSSSSGYQWAHSRLGHCSGTLSAWNVPGHCSEVLWVSILPADSTWKSSTAWLNMGGDIMLTICFCFWKRPLCHLWCRLLLLRLFQKQHGPESEQMSHSFWLLWLAGLQVCRGWQSPCSSLQFRQHFVLATVVELELKGPLVSSFGQCGFPGS